MANEFFKPNSGKIILTLLLFLVFKMELIACYFDLLCQIRTAVVYLPDLIAGSLPESIFLPLIIDLIFYYIIACVIYWVVNSLRRKKQA